MFYATFKQNGEYFGALYHDFQEYVNDTFDPGIETLAIIPFTVHGSSYAERRANVRETALEFQREAEELSYNELWHIQNWFAKMGKRYGLLKEFMENAIC